MAANASMIPDRPQNPLFAIQPHDEPREFLVSPVLSAAGFDVLVAVLRQRFMLGVALAAAHHFWNATVRPHS